MVTTLRILRNKKTHRGIIKDRENKHNVVAEVYQDYQTEISNKFEVLEY
jgi:hypothetical protein